MSDFLGIGDGIAVGPGWEQFKDVAVIASGGFVLGGSAVIIAQPYYQVREVVRLTSRVSTAIALASAIRPVVALTSRINTE